METHDMASSAEDTARVRRDGGGTTRVPQKAKTSAAAAFALVFGLSALITALLVVLAPFAILFGLIALVLGIVGIGKAKKDTLHEETVVTGRGVAISGLVLGLLALVLGIGILVGAATFLQDSGNLDRLEQGLQDLSSEIPTELPS